MSLSPETATAFRLIVSFSSRVKVTVRGQTKDFGGAL